MMHLLRELVGSGWPLKEHLVLGVLCGGLLCGLYVLGVHPLTVRISAHQAEFTALREQVERHDEQLATMRRLEQELVEQRQFLTQLHTTIPPTPDLETFLSDLESLSMQTGIRIRDYRPGVTEPVNARWNATQVRIGIVGDFGQVCRFLSAVENLPRKNAFRSFQLVPDSPAPGLCTGQIELDVYSHAPTPVAQRGDSLAR